MIEALRNAQTTSGTPTGNAASPATGGFGDLIEQMRLDADVGRSASEIASQPAATRDPAAERRMLDRLQQRRAVPMRADAPPATVRSSNAAAAERASAPPPTSQPSAARADASAPDTTHTRDTESGDPRAHEARSATSAESTASSETSADAGPEGSPERAASTSEPAAAPDAAALAAAGLISAATDQGTTADDIDGIARAASAAETLSSAAASADGTLGDASMDAAGTGPGQRSTEPTGDPASIDHNDLPARKTGAQAQSDRMATANDPAPAGTEPMRVTVARAESARAAANPIDADAGGRAAIDATAPGNARIADASGPRAPTDGNRTAPTDVAPASRHARPDEAAVAPGAAAILAAMGSAEHRSDDARDPPAAGAHEDLLASLAAGAAGAAASLPAHPVAATSTDASLGAAASTHVDLRMPLEAALESPAFPGEFAGTIESLALQGIEHAELVVNPPELGPIRISMSMDADTLSIAFASEHVETRQAIERSLPALQAALKEHGIELGDSRTSSGFDTRGGDGAPAQRQASGPSTQRIHSSGDDAGASAEAARAPAQAPGNTAQRRLLDLFA